MCTTEQTEWKLSVIPTNRILTDNELRSLTFSCVNDREFADVGLEVVLRELRKRTPVYPVVDVLVRECIRLAAQRSLSVLGTVPVMHKYIEFDYPTMQREVVVEQVSRYIVQGLRGNDMDFMYLDMLRRASDDDIESIIITLFDLHSALLHDRVVFRVIGG